jgi:hypothetical protein
MLPKTLLQSIRALSVEDKLLLIQTIAYMLQKDLAACAQPPLDDQNSAEPSPLSAIREDGLQKMRVQIAELLSRPNPTPEQMLPYGLFKGQLALDDEDFRFAEWHPSEEDLSGG